MILAKFTSFDSKIVSFCTDGGFLDAGLYGPTGAKSGGR
jgi:hypothetical protein